MSDFNDVFLRPFAAIRPDEKHAAEVVAPPYDVLNSAEAKEKATGKPHSFLHVSKPEIDLPDVIDPYDDAVYAKAAENFKSFMTKGVIKKENKACYYIYRLKMGEHVQTGIAVAADVDAYKHKILIHEKTLVKKENDRIKQIEAVGAQTGPVLLACEASETLKKIIAEQAKTKPEFSVEGDNEVVHTLWVVSDDKVIKQIADEFRKLDKAYIADGHHRSASAARIAEQRRKKAHTGDEGFNTFLAVVFPAEEMKIYDYNRVVKDLNGLSEEEFIKKISNDYYVIPENSLYKPAQKGEIGMYINGKWLKLEYKGDAQHKNPVDALDVSLLTDKVLGPILNIGDLRMSDRIDFVGGIRGLKELEKRVDSGEMAVAFAMFPTSMQELMDVASANMLMPPKSTWFEPKLADGVVSNPI